MKSLTVSEVADRCRVTRYTVYRWITCGILPATKAVKYWLIQEDDLEEFLTRPPKGWTMEQYVQSIVDGAPTLTDEQILRLRDALGRLNG